jgi:predicted metal-dependent hydrolase
MYPGGSIVVTSPAHVTTAHIGQFLNKKAKWILSKIDYLSQFPPTSHASTRQEYLKHKKTALALAYDRITHFNKTYGFKFGRVSIKNLKTLWGSCSRKGNLNFCYKIALVPPQHADYVIVHELCHLKEFNHSPKFWALVSRTIPNYKPLRKDLKKFGLSIN